jgi:hypothetical protein
MKLEHSLNTVLDKDAMRDRITTHLIKSGYRASGSQTSLHFERGSLFGSWLSLSPRNWKSNVEIQLSAIQDGNTQADILFNIDATGQLVTRNEREFWEAELNNLVKAISIEDIDTNAVTETARSALTQNLIAFLLILVLATVMTCVGVVLSGANLNASILSGLFGMVLGFIIAGRWLHFKIGG